MDLKVGDVLFLDTNVLLTATDKSRAFHEDARWLLGVAAFRGIHLALSGQILREYLVVATREQEANGLGLGIEDALVNVNAFRERAILYEENEAATRRMIDLVASRQGRGKHVHDLQVAATFLAHGGDYLVTENINDFDGIPGLRIGSVEAVRRAVEAIHDGRNAV